jgi:adenine/guanine phosphoribosyltransferase-like PRPP-binding protein
MVEIHPARIAGRWADGRALDVHTVRSTYLGDDEFGHAQFETERSPIGELVYRLKYRGDWGVVRGKRVLLFDDLFRSGATMNSVTALLYERAGAAEVYALTLTRTRSAQ